MWSGEIGYTQSAGDHFKIDAGLFYTKTDEYIAFSNSALVFVIGPTGQPALVGRAENIGNLTTYGAALSLSAELGRWTGLANYSWTRSDDSHMDADAIVAHLSDPKEATPRHKINAQLGYDTGRWFATVTGRYTSSTFQLAMPALGGYASTLVPSALAIDAKLGWRIRPSVTLNIAGENLTKARGAAGSPIWADRRVRAGVGVSL